MSGQSFQTWCRSGPGGLFCLPPEPAVLQGNATEIRKFLNESPSVQTIKRCMQSQTITSLFLAITASQALIETVSLCILKLYFLLLSQVSTKAKYQKICFYSLRPSFFVLSANASYLVLCNAEGASISEDPLHPYQWLAFIWCHWKCMHFLLGSGGVGGFRDGKADVANQLSWNGPTSPWGKKTVCLLSFWIALEEGERRSHVL